MPFHRRLLPILSSFIPVVGPAISPIVSSLLNGGPQITPSIQPLPVGQPVTLAATAVPDPLIWIPGVGFSGSDPAQRRAAEDLRQTEKISTDEIVAIHNNVGKANFVTEARRLMTTFVAARAPVQAQIEQQAQQTTAPLVAPSRGVTMPPQFQPQQVGPLIPVAAAAGGAIGRAGLVTIFSRIFSTVGVAAGFRAVVQWFRTNPGTAAATAAAAGLTIDQLLDDVSQESAQRAFKRQTVLSRDDLKGFERTVRIAKKLGVFTRGAPARRAARRIGRHRHRVKSF